MSGLLSFLSGVYWQISNFADNNVDYSYVEVQKSTSMESFPHFVQKFISIIPIPWVHTDTVFNLYGIIYVETAFILALITAVIFVANFDFKCRRKPPFYVFKYDPELPAVWPRWKAFSYQLLPFRTVSRLWSFCCQWTLPVCLRRPLIGLYVRIYDVKLEEASVSDLTMYRSMSQFFRRSLKPGLRPVSSDILVSPADGRIMGFGRVENGMVDHVKGFSYRLDVFMGPTVPKMPSLKRVPEKSLYYCVVYLAPGDYHCFHSPADWKVQFRRHFTGKLLSVSLSVLSNVPELFCLNERVLVSGKWAHGFFSMTAVGATNVGTIRFDFDKQLRTNQMNWTWRRGDHYADHHYPTPVTPERGERMGEFNLGSTIVLMFEAPSNFEFKVETGQTIKYGEALGHVRDD